MTAPRFFDFSGNFPRRKGPPLFYLESLPAQPSPLKVTAGLSNTLVISKAHLAQIGLFSSAVIDRTTVVVSPHLHWYS